MHLPPSSCHSICTHVFFLPLPENELSMNNCIAVVKLPMLPASSGNHSNILRVPRHHVPSLLGHPVCIQTSWNSPSSFSSLHTSPYKRSAKPSYTLFYSNSFPYLGPPQSSFPLHNLSTPPMMSTLLIPTVNSLLSLPGTIYHSL